MLEVEWEVVIHVHADGEQLFVEVEQAERPKIRSSRSKRVFLIELERCCGLDIHDTNWHMACYSWCDGSETPLHVLWSRYTCGVDSELVGGEDVTPYEW